MKKITLLLTLIFPAFFSVLGQVGVNTDMPGNLFHIDASKNNTSSIPTTTEVQDDVVIDNNAQMGLGVLEPTAAMDINDDVTPLRIEDGATASEKVLESVTVDGTAHWVEQVKSYTSLLKVTTDQSFDSDVESELILDNELLIPQDGKYLATVSISAQSVFEIVLNNPMRTFSLYVYLYRDNAGTLEKLDQIEFYLTTVHNQLITFTTPLFAGQCAPGEKLVVRLRPYIGGAGIKLGPSVVTSVGGFTTAVILNTI